MIKAVVFDLDGTLLDRARSLIRFAQQQYNQYTALQTMSQADYIEALVTLDDNGHVWKDRVYQQLLAQYQITGVGWETLLNDYVDNFAQACIGFAGLTEMLSALSEQGYQLGIVTNGRSPFQERNLQALGIESAFSAIVVSEAVGLRKPDPAIFTEALRRLGRRASEAVFVGDSPKADIEGAHSAGMRAVWKVNAYWRSCDLADAICHDLMNLPNIVRQI